MKNEFDRLIDNECLKMLEDNNYFLETLSQFEHEFTDEEIKFMLENYDKLKTLKDLLDDLNE